MRISAKFQRGQLPLLNQWGQVYTSCLIANREQVSSWNLPTNSPPFDEQRAGTKVQFVSGLQVVGMRI